MEDFGVQLSPLLWYYVLNKLMMDFFFPTTEDIYYIYF